MPRFELSDLPRERWAALMMVSGAGWLVGRALTTGLGGSLGELDVMAASVALYVPVVSLLGPRTIVVEDAGIRVTRRGRVVLERRLDEVREFRGLGLASRLVFVDGAWLLWFISGPDWGPATDFIASRLVADEPREQLFSAPASDRLRVLAHRLRFPPRCLGCGGAPGHLHSLTVRRGLDLGFWSLFEARDVPAPACAGCRRRRRFLGALAHHGPLVGIVVCFFLPLLTPLRGTPVLVLLGLLIALFFALRNRGDEWADAWVWGVRGRLAVDGSVHLRVRDPSLRAEIVEASRTGEATRVTPPTLEV